MHGQKLRHPRGWGLEREALKLLLQRPEEVLTPVSFSADITISLFPQMIGVSVSLS